MRHIMTAFAVLALEFRTVVGDSLSDALSSTVFLNAGTVSAGDQFRYLDIPCMYLEADNVTCAQCSWGVGGACPYLFQITSNVPSNCTPDAPQPGNDLPGSDYTATALQNDDYTVCESLCCAEDECGAWTYVPSAPSDYLSCLTGDHCCYRKTGFPEFKPSTLPNIISGFVNKTVPPSIPPPLGMRSAVPLGGVGAGALELRADGTFHEVTIMNQSPAGAAKFGVLQDLILAIRIVAASGGAAVTKVVRTSPPTFGANISGVDAISYSGSYPVTRLQISDSDLLVNATIYAYSALKPGNMVASAAPAVWFTLAVDNPTGAPINASLFVSQPLASVNNCARPSSHVLNTSSATTPAACLIACSKLAACASWTFDCDSGACALASDVPWSVYSTTSYCGVGGMWSGDGHVLNFEQDPAGTAGGPANGDISIFPVTGPSLVQGSMAVADSIAGLYAAFANEGILDSSVDDVTAGSFVGAIASVGAAVATTTVAPGAVSSATIGLSWYFPDRDHMNVNVGNFYSTLFDNSVDVANQYSNIEDLTTVVTTLNAHHAVFAGAQSSLPSWMQDFAINEMSHFRGMIWTADGRMREFEANDCPDVDSQHNDHQVWKSSQLSVLRLAIVCRMFVRANVQYVCVM